MRIKKKNTYEGYRKQLLLYLGLSIISVLLFDFTTMNRELFMNGKQEMLLAAIFVLLAFLYGLFRRYDKKHPITMEKRIQLVIFLGFLVRFIYVINCHYTNEQNDLGDIIGGSGHLNYIIYLCKNGWFPNKDPRLLGQFYQTPLHHIIASIWLRINLFLGYSPSRACENLQALPLFYNCALMIYVQQILIRLNAALKARHLVAVLLSFFPYLIFSSGSLNNDALATLLMVMSLYNIITWYQEHTWKNIIRTALCIGLAVMTKISAAIIAPGMAFVFVYVLWKEAKSNLIKLIKQYVLFGVVSLPIGLWYPIRNLVLYGMELTYIPRLSESSTLYLGDKYTVWERLFDFSLTQWLHPTIAWNNQETMCDHNLFVSLCKFGAFGEHNVTTSFYEQNSLYYWIALGMVFLMAGLLTVGIVVFLFWLWKGKEETVYRGLFGMVVLAFMISYVKFCLEYPHICTMNIRYILVAVLILMICMSLGFYEIASIREAKQKVQMELWIERIVILFSGMSILTGIARLFALFHYGI